jgi:N-acetyl-gamma-glutamyl-phosphate reductase
MENTKSNLIGHDVVFLALPHTKSAEVASWLEDSILVLDCGADFRLESKIEFEKFYKSEHMGTWVYGMPELLIEGNAKQREKIFEQKRIAVPGCNATAATLAYSPLLRDGLIRPQDLVSALSVGSSGAGRNAEVNQIEQLPSAYAYQVGGIHRHIPEVIQNLSKVSQSLVSLTFTPVRVPMFRGILAVNTAIVETGVGFVDIEKSFEDAYGNEPFIELLTDGNFPNTAAVEFKNKVQIGVAFDLQTRRVTVVTSIDNLVKGTAGAAIQCMNIALGFDETCGLTDSLSHD